MPMKMEKQQLILVLGVGFAILAVIMVRFYLVQQQAFIAEQERKKLENIIPVMIAKDDIPRNTQLTDSMLDVQNIPRQFVSPGAVTSMDRIIGYITLVPINKGEQITQNKVISPIQKGGLAEVTPSGKRAVPLSAENLAGLSGMIKPRDYIDVYVMVAVPVKTLEDEEPAVKQIVAPLFQNVLVLAVGQETSPVLPRSSKTGEGQQGFSSSLITIALTPDEAGLLSFVQEHGKIIISLRPSADSKIQSVSISDWQEFFERVYPEGLTPPREERIEIQRGTKIQKQSVER